MGGATLPVSGTQAQKCWKLPMDVELEPLLVWSVERGNVNRLLVAARLEEGKRGEQKGPNPKVLRAVDSLFEGRVRKRLLATQWPGNKMIGHEGGVFVIDFDATLIRPMVQAASRLADWTRWNDPPLPEDLCLYRQGDEWPAFFSVTHESDAWAIGDAGPPVERAVQEPLDPDSLLIPTGQEDFVEGARPWAPGALPLAASSPAKSRRATRSRGK